MNLTKELIYDFCMRLELGLFLSSIYSMFILANLVVLSLILIHSSVLTISGQAGGLSVEPNLRWGKCLSYARKQIISCVFFYLSFPSFLTNNSGVRMNCLSCCKCRASLKFVLQPLHSFLHSVHYDINACLSLKQQNWWLLTTDLTFRFHLICCLLLIAQFTINETDVSWNILWWLYFHHDSFLLSWLTCFTVSPLVKHPL